MKLIRFKDVRPGDVVCIDVRCGTDRHRVQRCTVDDSQIGLVLESTCESGGHDELVGLVYRPRLEGMTDADARALIQDRALEAAIVLMPKNASLRAHMAEPEVAIIALREALEAYELGKTTAGDVQEKERGPVRAAGAVTRDWMGD